MEKILIDTLFIVYYFFIEGKENEMKKKRIVVIPSDALDDYIKNGMSEEYIREYYNPKGYYEEVFVVSPLEKGITKKYGMTIIGTSVFGLHKVIKKINPDIIRAYDGFKCADWLSLARIDGIPTVCSVHDSREELIHQSLKYADVVICMSNIVKSNVCKVVKGIDKNRVIVMPNRVDVELFSKKNNEIFNERQNEIYKHKYHIIHIGRKTVQKNIDTVIKAAKYLDDDYSIIFIGRGNAEPYQQLAEIEGVTDKCFFVESIPNNELPYWYSWCDCMCTPSRWEGFGFVFIEAAACGAKIITSDLAPMNEYLQDGISAFLIKDFENPQVVAEYIRKVCISEYSSITNEARKVAMGFSKETVDDKEIKIMENAKNISSTSLKQILFGVAIMISYDLVYFYRSVKHCFEAFLQHYR